MHVKCADGAEYILKTPHSLSVISLHARLGAAFCKLFKWVKNKCLKVHVTFYRFRYAKTPFVHLKQ
jgi:hypothetical protein